MYRVVGAGQLGATDTRVPHDPDTCWRCAASRSPVLALPVHGQCVCAQRAEQTKLTSATATPNVCPFALNFGINLVRVRRSLSQPLTATSAANKWLASATTRRLSTPAGLAAISAHSRLVMPKSWPTNRSDAIECLRRQPQIKCLTSDQNGAPLACCSAASCLALDTRYAARHLHAK